MVVCVFSTSQKIVLEEHPQNDLFCVEWDVKHVLSQLKKTLGNSWVCCIL